MLVQALQAGTAVVVALCYGVGYDSMGLLAAAQLVFWTSSNLAWSANNAFTQEHFQPHEYASISGKQEVIMQATTLGSGALGVVLLEMWGMFEFACFAALASGIAMSSYLLAPYRRQLRQTHSASFSNKSREPRGVYSTPTVLRVSHALDVNLPNLNVSEQVGADSVCRDEYFR